MLLLKLEDGLEMGDKEVEILVVVRVVESMGCDKHKKAGESVNGERKVGDVLSGLVESLDEEVREKEGVLALWKYLGVHRTEDGHDLRGVSLI